MGDFVKKNLAADIGLSYAICTVVMLNPSTTLRACPEEFEGTCYVKHLAIG